MGGNEFIDEYLKRFKDSVQGNEEAVSEFKERIEKETSSPKKVALELLKKYSGDLNSFFQAKEIGEVSEGYYGNIVGTVGSIRCIEFERDGRKGIRCVGFLEDKSGRLPFTNFTDSPGKINKGDTILVINANVGQYNEKPYLTISYKNEIDILEKSTYKNVSGELLQVRDLRPEMFDIYIKGSLRVSNSRENVGRDSVTLYSGFFSDNTGTISVQSWGIPFNDGLAEIRGASIKTYKEKLYLQIGKGTKITFLGEEKGEYSNLEELTDSLEGTAQGEAIVMGVQSKNSIVSVCSECQNIVKDSECKKHPDAPVEKILRVGLIVDDGYSSQFVYAYQKALEKFVKGGKKQIANLIQKDDVSNAIKEIEEKLRFKFINYSVYGFRGSSGMYLELQDFSLIDEKEMTEKYQKLMEAMK